MATGLLLLGVESATRLLTYLVGLDKDYTATIRLGQSTTTDDAEGERTEGADARALSAEAIEAAIVPLRGVIQQVPSTVSAIKVEGRRAYDLARAGEEVELRSREVTVAEFEVLAEHRGGSVPVGCVDLEVRVSVSSGTYVRALARDLGATLGVGGHLTALRRTRVGPFEVDDAIALRSARPASGVDEDLPDALRSPADIATSLYPAHTLDPERLRDLAHGKRLELDVPDTPVLALLGPEGRLAGLAEIRGRRSRILVNFPTAEVLG